MIETITLCLVLGGFVFDLVVVFHVMEKQKCCRVVIRA